MPMPGSKELEPTDTHTRDADSNSRRNSLTDSGEVNTNTITPSQTNLTSSSGSGATSSSTATGIRFELTYPTIDDAGTISLFSFLYLSLITVLVSHPTTIPLFLLYL